MVSCQCDGRKCTCIARPGRQGAIIAEGNRRASGPSSSEFTLSGYLLADRYGAMPLMYGSSVAAGAAVYEWVDKPLQRVTRWGS